MTGSSYVRLRLAGVLMAGLWGAVAATCAGTSGGVRPAVPADTVFVRVNLVGYLPGDAKVAVAFSEAPVHGAFTVVEEPAGAVVFQGEVRPAPAKGWGRFAHYYELDFSGLATPGRYRVRMEQTGDVSAPFTIGPDAYGAYHEDLLGFLRQQRCGYNPFLDRVCHRRDGRTFYGPVPDSTYLDVSGGWHDAGDQLKYLITGSNATARLLLAYLLEPDKFGDVVNDLGQPRPNGLPDVLDEARWGLDWLHKLHPEPHLLVHQVADDRDHIGWKWPDRDPSDYGWGPNSYRPAYVATGRPQGLRQYQSEATGMANLAGRFAAAMALAARLWQDLDPAFAAKCLAAAKSAYALGRAHEGYQQGNSYGAPYRYAERTWADDMEWGAAELYAVTRDPAYLADARRYARLAGATSWMPRDTTEHYEYYPFVNVGHFALYPHVDGAFRDTLAGYYRDGIEHALRRGQTNPFRIGVPFIWCSNNLATALITQILLYERMTGDTRYHDFMLAQRDWLLGRNPWGTSMFMSIPRDGEYPQDVHTSIWALTRREVPGGLVDGPVYATIFNSLRGLHLTAPDEFARFQNPYVVYHDDIGDYATNEPTMDGTAGAVYFMAHFGSAAHLAR
ncbi:glycoside hydrolase family 9 protein [Rhodocaloribacter litoris]|uniref:glycoside hydrolase family 9 protein n=1 Tax=Rhodocaloribacter litoris TaxID=2558931 RepID=UPI001E6148A1|nr:glycoside hydrolase family 9 protein [Rhodocaloribacter litoris]QXD14549.1 glycoside hydrolase family 9 protein [Rhodocaloribacter litoris]